MSLLSFTQVQQIGQVQYVVWDTRSILANYEKKHLAIRDAVRIKHIKRKLDYK